MKKSFKVLAIAAIASLTVVACNNNNTEATDTIDSTAIEQVAEEQEIIAEPAEVLDTTPTVEEKVATTAKKAVKTVVNKEAKEMAKALKEETKPTEEAIKAATAVPARLWPPSRPRGVAAVRSRRCW